MQRPSLPAGHPLSASVTVSKACYITEEVEVYSVCDGEQGGSGILLLAKDSSGLADAWWQWLRERAVPLDPCSPERVSPRFPAACMAMLSGKTLGQQDYRQAPQEALTALLQAMIEVAQAAALKDLTPRLDKDICWLTAQGTLIPFFPQPHIADAAGLAYYVAACFYQIVTGVENASMGRPAALTQWSKGAGSELSRAVAACFPDELGRQKTQSLAALEASLPASPHMISPGRVAEPPAADRVVSKPSRPTLEGRGLLKVAGMHALKSLLQRDVVEPVRNPEPYRKYGLSIPNGILLYGPPGCGKTYIARALAEEMGHHFVEVVPSEVASTFAHGTVLRLREVFEDAAERAPAVVFIDEFEALVPSRSGLGGHQHYRAEEVNEILTLLHGCSEKNVFVVAATNQPELIDPAVRRTGRLDKLIYVGPPDLEARREMLVLHLGTRPVAASLDAGELAATLEGYSASDIRFLVDQAARYALSRAQKIDGAAFAYASARMVASIPPGVEKLYRSIETRGG